METEPGAMNRAPPGSIDKPEPAFDDELCTARRSFSVEELEVGERCGLARMIHEPRRFRRLRGLGERVGSRRALLGANHRGKVWKPFQGFHR